MICFKDVEYVINITNKKKKNKFFRSIFYKLFRPVKAAEMMQKLVQKMDIGVESDAIVVFDPAMQGAFEAQGYKDVALQTEIGNTVKLLVGIKYD